ncbi:hypothetical protein AB0J52_03760 [Spirillospora sp. NPDC049652]
MRDHIDQVLADFLEATAALGAAPGQVRLSSRVTDLDDADLDYLRERYAAAGLTGVLLVDERVPARPGTIRGRDLSPELSSVADQAAAVRRDGKRRSTR